MGEQRTILNIYVKVRRECILYPYPATSSSRGRNWHDLPDDVAKQVTQRRNHPAHAL